MALDYEVKIEELQLKQTSDLEGMLVEEAQQHPLPSEEMLSIVEPEVVRIPPDPTALMAWVDDVSIDMHQKPELTEDQLIARVHDILAEDAIAELAQEHAAELDADRDETGVTSDFVPNTERDYEADVPDPLADYFVASANRPFLDQESLFNGGGGGGGGGGGASPPSDQGGGDGDGDGDAPAESGSPPAKPDRKPDVAAAKANEPARANRDAPEAKPSKSGREKDRK